MKTHNYEARNVLLAIVMYVHLNKQDWNKYVSLHRLTVDFKNWGIIIVQIYYYGIITVV